jgi:putative ABC transport system substrate-binding protein
MIRRRAFVGGLALLLAEPHPAGAQPTKVARIGWLAGASRETGAVNLDALREGLRTLGYVEGRHYAIEARYSKGRPEQLAPLATELTALPVDVIVVGGTPTALAAMQATRSIPIVVVNSADPVGSGLVRSFARPEGNVTGVGLALDEVSHKWLEILRTLRPRLTRAAVVQNSTNQSMSAMLKPLEVSARALGITLTVHDTTRSDELPPAFKAIAESRAEAVVVLPDAFLQNERRRLLEQLAGAKLPSIFANRLDVVAGGLLSYGPDFVDSYRRAATHVDKILKGAKPAELPVERPSKFELVVNMKTARALRLTIPPSVLLQAEQVTD